MTKEVFVVVDLVYDVDGQVDDAEDVINVAQKYGCHDSIEGARFDAAKDHDLGKAEIWKLTAEKVEVISRER